MPKDYLPGRHEEGPADDGRALAERRERIARLTRRGGITTGAPPPAYSRGDDWQTIQEHDPFEKLYLDYRQVERISDEMVRLHHAAIRRFWVGLVEEYEGGGASPAAKAALLDTYGGGSEAQLRIWPNKVDEAFDRLSTPEKRVAESAQMAEAEEGAARHAVRVELLEAMKDQQLSRTEADTILARAEEAGWDREVAAEHVLDEIARDGWRPFDPVDDATAVSRLTSAVWYGPLVPDPNAPPPPPDVEKVLGLSVQMALAQGELTPEAADAVFKHAAENGIAEDDAAALLRDRLRIGHDDGYVLAPGESPPHGSLADQLRTARRVSAARFEQEHDAARLAAYRAHLEAAADRDEVGPGAVRTVLDDGSEYGVGREAAASLLLEVLARRSFEPADDLSGDTDYERVLSTPWLSPTALVRRARATVPSPPAPAPAPPPAPQPAESGGGGMMVLLVLGAIVAVIAFAIAGVLEGDEVLEAPIYTAEVVAGGLNVRSVPTATGGQATVLTTVTRGTRVAVLEERTNASGDPWVRVRAGGVEGWISSKPQYVRRVGVSSDRAPSGPVEIVDDVIGDGEVIDPDADAFGGGGLADAGANRNGGGVDADRRRAAPPTAPSPRVEPAPRATDREYALGYSPSRGVNWGRFQSLNLTRYVDVAGGDYASFRDAPSARHGGLVARVAEGTRLQVSGCLPRRPEDGHRWCQSRFGGRTGWVYDINLSRRPPPPPRAERAPPRRTPPQRSTRPEVRVPAPAPQPSTVPRTPPPPATRPSPRPTTSPPPSPRPSVRPSPRTRQIPRGSFRAGTAGGARFRFRVDGGRATQQGGNTRIELELRQESIDFQGSWVFWRDMLSNGEGRDNQGRPLALSLEQSRGWTNGRVRPGGARTGTVVYITSTPLEELQSLTLRLPLAPPDRRSAVTFQVPIQ